TPLEELPRQEAALKALERRIAELDERHIVTLDKKSLAGRLAVAASEFRATLKRGGPGVRLLLQRVLNGQRVPCHPFREDGRRGYRFRAEEISYTGVLSNDIGGPNGVRTRVSALRVGLGTVCPMAPGSSRVHSACTWRSPSLLSRAPEHPG